jgi:PIN domain nuclease of toxin-antitoxin system
MAYLLDTHALIWWWDDNSRLPESIRELMADPDNDVLVSAAVGWEMATKVRVGKLPEMADAVADRNFDQWVIEDGFRHLDVRQDHGVRAGLLPGEHRDPFDRMIAAQALIEGLTVISRDPALAAFGCDVIW